MSANLFQRKKTATQGKRGLQPLLPLTLTDNAARCLELLAELLNRVVVSDPTYNCEDKY